MAAVEINSGLWRFPTAAHVGKDKMDGAAQIQMMCEGIFGDYLQEEKEPMELF